MLDAMLREGRKATNAVDADAMRYARGMSVGSIARRAATADDLARLPDSVRAEVVGGAIVEKASPTAEHGDAQLGLGSFVRQRFHRRTGGPLPGGWWILSEVEIALGVNDIYRPDLVGWRRERAPERPTGRPIRLRPDWVCEILSSSNAKTDLVDKFRAFQRHEVPHYWIVDPERAILTVYRWQDEGYVVALQATRGETVRAEPFEAVELRVGILFGDEEQE